jgi:hypothetical protein
MITATRNGRRRAAVRDLATSLIEAQTEEAAGLVIASRLLEVVR